MERKTNSSSHQKRVDSGPVLKRNHTTNYATRQCKDGRDGGDNCERGLESVRYERVRIDDEVREDPERNACKFSESACEKPSYSSPEGSRLYNDSSHQTCYERSYLWDGSAENEVDEKSCTDREKKVRGLILRCIGKLVGHGFFRPVAAISSVAMISCA